VLCEPSAENKPNGITGRLNYQEMNHFIRGYGMAIASQRTESGLLPAQLIQQRNELLDALKTLLKQARQDSFELDKSVSDTPAEEKAALVIRKIEKT